MEVVYVNKVRDAVNGFTGQGELDYVKACFRNRISVAVCINCIRLNR